MPAKVMWKGGISFGLVNIPVGVYVATEGREFSFNQLCDKAHRIRYKKWCPVEEREVAYSNKKGLRDQQLGKLLVENLSSEHLDLSKYSDAYTKELERL